MMSERPPRLAAAAPVTPSTSEEKAPARRCTVAFRALMGPWAVLVQVEPFLSTLLRTMVQSLPMTLTVPHRA